MQPLLFPPSFSLHSTPLFPLNRLSTNEELVGLGAMTKHRPIWRTIDVRIPETDKWSFDGFCELGENTPLLTLGKSICILEIRHSGPNKLKYVKL